MKKLYFFNVLAATLMASTVLLAQSNETDVLKEYLVKEEAYKAEAIGDLVVTKSFTSRQLQVNHVYASQAINGIRISNSHITAALSLDGEVKYLTERLIPLNSYTANSSSPSFALEDVVGIQLNQTILSLQVEVEPLPSNEYTLSMIGENYSYSTKAELVYYFLKEEGIRLAWHFDADLEEQGHWYEYVVDAENGAVLHKHDLVISCSVHGTHKNEACVSSLAATSAFEEEFTTADGSQYRVLEFPIESPNHGVRTIVSEPADEIASPFGWHDTNGMEGADFTITRGNNVYAYDDIPNNNVPGSSPDGGADLIFDYDFDQNQTAVNFLDAAITNLFYANNRIHDILFAYGFDEVSGNFQQNNYSDEGDDGDYVEAQAHDGGGLNNANMATPSDGQSPRMQMYLWTTDEPIEDALVVNPNSPLVGNYSTSGASSFGPDFPSAGITANLVLMNDNSGDIYDGCQDVVNSAELDGAIALVRRGTCAFVEKVLEAQNAGAVACLVVNNVPDGVVTMPGDNDLISIPSTMLLQSDGEAFIEELANGGTINVSINTLGLGRLIDGSFDNGIVVHEYIHGLSNRLTGGANASGCLQNEEQMGEGWSDWYALMMTMDLSIENPVYRPMGTFAIDEPTNGTGIRPVAYDTSFAVNAFTYAQLPNSNISVPHGVGFIWSTMLWDLTWALIDEYGYDEDIINGVGGNNIAMQLVTDALKLQVCSPGFVDGRDAILAADELNYDGANECLIWKVFARRGLGVDADQGSSFDREDGTAGFGLPVQCQQALVPPVADFSVSVEQTCSGEVAFQDLSTDIPQEWLWDFGDGNTSDDQNPVHTYTEDGVYTVSLTVTNTLGEDVATASNLITYDQPESPEADDVEGCIGDFVTLTGTTEEGTIEWVDQDGTLLAYADEVNFEVEEGISTVTARTVIQGEDLGFAGPEDNTFAPGGNHGSNFVGTVNFTAERPFVISTAFVVSGDTGPRTIRLWNQSSGNGQVVDEVTVDIDFEGPGTIPLNLKVPAAGNYSFGLNQADLYRNNEGVEYPFILEDVMTITGSSATQPGFYYYFYNLEIVEESCFSDPIEVDVTGVSNADFDADDEDLTVTFTDNSIGADSWFWEFGDGNTSDQQNPVHTYDVLGQYEVSLTTNNLCETTQTIDVGPLSISDFENSGYSLVPNPATDFIRIDKKGIFEAQTLNVMDISGKLMIQRNLNGSNAQMLDVSSLSSGTYIVSLSNANSEVIHRQKLIIVR